MAQHGTKPVGAMKTAFEVIEALKELNGAGVTELADHLGVPKSTAHSHLSTLEQFGYIQKQDDTYRLGLRFLDLGGYIRDQMELHQTGRPELEELAEETGDWANLMAEENGQGVYVDFTRGERAVELDIYPGKRVYLHATALGKSILAHKSEPEVRDAIDQHGLPALTEDTVTDEAELFDRLETIRERGYAYDREERLQGLKCVAAPIVINDNHVVGAVSVSGPTTRMKGERFEDEIPEMVTNAANVIGINLTYS